MPAIVHPIKTVRSDIVIIGRKPGLDPHQKSIRADVPPALVFFALLIAATTTIAARDAIVRAAPATAFAYARLGLPVNLRGLSIEGVRATIGEEPEGGQELLVAGEVVNLRDSETPVPSLRLMLRGEDRRELYIWSSPGPKARLGPHERAAFRARLAGPPAGVRDVLVKFDAPGDKALFTE
jgi:hypothetical protein